MPVLSPPVSVPREAAPRKTAEHQYSAVDDMIKRQREKVAAHAASLPAVATDSVARKLFESPRGDTPAPDEGELEKRLEILSELSKQLEHEMREERGARRRVEELLEIERELAASAARMHVQHLDAAKGCAAAERAARKRAEEALAKCLEERTLQSSRTAEAQSTAQRWEAECGRVAAHAEVELAKFRALHDEELRRRASEVDKLRDALRECEQRQLVTEQRSSAALEQAATEHEDLQQALAAKTAQAEVQQSELAAARSARASAEDRAATAQAGVEAAHEELKERIAFERGERIKLERKNEKLSKALRLERTRRAGCPVCRRNYCGDASVSANQDGANSRPGTSDASAVWEHHLASTTLSEAEARRALGVELNATIAQVKAAYRQCVLASHPDKNPQAAADGGAKFHRVQAAYATLMSLAEQQQKSHEQR